MRTILKIAVLAAFPAIGCSCSWFAKKPVQVSDRAEAPARAAAKDAQNRTAGSAAEGPVPEPSRPAAEAFKKEAISILIKADPQLNRFQRNAHTLFLCIYQLKDPNGFNQLAQEKDGIPKLLECSRFDASVANAKQFTVQPGQELNDVRDRAEGARYIGLATGYYGTGKEKVTELSPLAPGRGGPSGTSISIELGPREISSVKVN